jgi:hypothetical protein
VIADLLDTLGSMLSYQCSLAQRVGSLRGEFDKVVRNQKSVSVELLSSANTTTCKAKNPRGLFRVL